MQNKRKISPFEKISEGTKNCLLPRLDDKDLYNLSQCSTRMNMIFSKDLKKRYHKEPGHQNRKAKKFLLHVVYAEYGYVKNMLELEDQNGKMSLLTYRGTIKDNANRIFNNILPMEYVRWALDDKIYKIITENVNQLLNNFIQLDELHKAKLLASFYGFLITYDNQPSYFKEFYYKFNDLIDAYKAYIINFSKSSASARAIQCYNINKLQSLAPLNIQHECNFSKKLLSFEEATQEFLTTIEVADSKQQSFSLGFKDIPHIPIERSPYNGCSIM